MEDTEVKHTETNKSGFNPMIILVLIVVGVVGWMVWLSKEKSQTPVAMKQQPVVTQKQEPTVAQTQSAVKEITVEGGMFYFKPNEIKVKKGEKVKITFTNKEGMHDFVIDELNVRTKRIKGGETDTVEFTPDKTGSFEFYCSVGSHRQMGMKGTLVVE